MGNDFQLKVEQVGDETNVHHETGNLVIRGKLTLTAPNDATLVWKVGDTTRAISWTAKGLTNVALAYTKNDGTDGYANTIISSTAASAGSYTWNPTGPPAGIPTSAPSNQFRVRNPSIGVSMPVSHASGSNQTNFLHLSSPRN